MSKKLLKYALKDGRLTHVDEVANGAGCSCTCPACGIALIAKNNTKNRKTSHFAHEPGTNCAHGYETALHLLAKTVFSELRQLHAPDFHHDYRPYNRGSFFSAGRLVSFDAVSEECRVDVGTSHFIADCLATISGKQLVVEFAVTHFVADEGTSKRQKFIEAGLPTIEIDLRECPLDKDAIQSFLLSKTPSIAWLHNPRLEQEYKAVCEKKDLLLHAQRKQRQANAEAALQAKIERFEAYKHHARFRIFRLNHGHARNCPEVIQVRQSLLSKGYGKISLTRRILEGAKWNGEIYGRYPNGSWIFVDDVRQTIYPPSQHSHTEAEAAAMDSLHGILKTIQETIHGAKRVGQCQWCPYKVEVMELNGELMGICGRQVH